MSHITLRQSYKSLSDRLNLFPQGAPPTELLFRILQVLFTKEEAALVALLPIRPFTVATAARNWKQPEGKARATLENLASRGMLLDVEVGEERFFVLPPPMAGFFEFSMMRVGNGYDQKLLAELFYQYLNVEEDFVKNLFCGAETRVGRVFVNESAVGAGTALEVMDYERASEVVRTASHIGVGTCYCRHKMKHLNRACGAPLDICLTFNGTAQSLIKHGIARQADVPEGMSLIEQARGHDLVQFGENVREQVAFICNCCGCCCEALLAPGVSRSSAPSPPPTSCPRSKQGTVTAAGSVWRRAPWRPWPWSRPEIPASPSARRRSSSGTSAWAAACASAPAPETPCRSALGESASSPPSRRPTVRCSWPSNEANSRTSSSTTRPTGTTALWPPSWARSSDSPRSNRSWPAGR